MKLFEIVRKRGDKWVVLTSDGSRVLGKHSTKKKANKQLAAIEINKHLGEKEMLDVKTLSVEEIAKKHGVPVKSIQHQLAKGIKVELEHTTDDKLANEIARDHLGEFPDYYDRLERAEK